MSALLAGPTVHAQDGDQAQARAEGFSLRSADGAWTLRLRGLIQLDGRTFADDSAPNEDNEWLLRRVRPTFEGTFGERIGFRLMPDFGGGRTEVPDAWIDVELKEGLILRVGKFKPPVGYERLRSANHLQLIERSVVTELVPRRDIGVQLSGGSERLSWATGLFNGVVDGGAGDEDPDGKQDLAARVFSHPFAGGAREGVFSGLGIGISASYGGTDGIPGILPLLPAYRSPGQNAVFAYRVGADGTYADGERLRVSPQFHWFRGAAGVSGEWARVSQDVHRVGATFDRAATLDHEAWQLTGNWFISGATAGYRDPNAPGAIELVARVSELNVDPLSFTEGNESFANPAVAVQEARTWAVGVNWLALPGLKASLSYQHTAFRGGLGTGDRPDEDVLLARLQLYF
jgi:phosphate-selective porin OprO/OprP